MKEVKKKKVKLVPKFLVNFRIVVKEKKKMKLPIAELRSSLVRSTAVQYKQGDQKGRSHYYYSSYRLFS